ncbi:MAG: hypothetical protein ACK52I_00635, partial [Pseudomonadota bacterium]
RRNLRFFRLPLNGVGCAHPGCAPRPARATPSARGGALTAGPAKLGGPPNASADAFQFSDHARDRHAARLTPAPVHGVPVDPKSARA